MRRIFELVSQAQGKPDLSAGTYSTTYVQAPAHRLDGYSNPPALLITTFLGYLTYRSSLATTLVPVGYESYEHIETAPAEPCVTAQPDSQYSDNPPYVKSPGEYIRLNNNPAAINVDFETLKAFLLSDETDRGWYIPGIQMCEYFAETLHNNVEQHGIRCGIVIVQFEDGSAPHALNAFETTDRGLVYIDCTGIRSSPATFEEWFCKLVYPRGQDRVAYIVKGKQYGTVPLADAESTDYSFYLGYIKSSMLRNSPLLRPIL